MRRKRDDPKRDAAHLEDMLDAARAVARFVHGKSRAEYRDDLMLRSAVERQIEIIGEAARRVTDAFQTAHPEVPWRPIMAQRHRIAHEYDALQDDLIWTVATVHVPNLIGVLEPLVTQAWHDGGGRLF
jgi:uncharacterized protein with HEPN domain